MRVSIKLKLAGVFLAVLLVSGADRWWPCATST